MNNAELYGLTLDQHKALERLDRAGRVTVRDQANIQTNAKRYPPPVRVIAMTDRVYDSTVNEALPIFEYDRERTVYTVEQVGSALAGYLALTVNGVRFVVECRIDSLSEVEAAVPGVRATVFPGLWEFDFGTLDETAAAAITVAVEAITPDEDATLCALFDDEESVAFTGAVIVRQEYWVTVPDEDNTPAVATRDVTDAIPFATSTVAKGAIGLGFWSWDAGYIIFAWQCRTFSHASLVGSCVYVWAESTPYSGVYGWVLQSDACDNGTTPTPPVTDGTTPGETRSGTCSIGGA